MIMFGGEAMPPVHARTRHPEFKNDVRATIRRRRNNSSPMAGAMHYSIPSSIQADNGAGLTKGIIGLVNKGQPRKPDDWGALRAWAWGASRGLDYLETEPGVDAKQVGHRRRLALWQGRARDDGVRSRASRWCWSAPPAKAAPSCTGAIGRSGGEPDRLRRISLDGRQLPEVRRGRRRRSAARTPATCRWTRMS